MAREAGIPRSALLMAAAVPLALLLGFLLAQPLSLRSLVVVSGILGVLLLPLLIRWHHPLLVVSWNAAIAPYLLPGQPSLWMLVTVVSLPLAVLTRALDPKRRLLDVPSITLPLLLLVAITVITALDRGGLGLRVLGSAQYGGKRYIMILLAIAGYFALSWMPIQRRQARLLTALFFLSGATAVFSDLAYAGGPAFYFLFNLFPVSMAGTQILSDMTTGQAPLMRLAGVSVGATAISYLLLVRYGLRGILDPTRWWRLALFLGVFLASLMGGFRSVLVVTGMVCCFLFFLEGLHRTKYLALLLAYGLATAAVVAPFTDRMPLAVQRALSILPVPVDPQVAVDARHSTDWRLELWRVLWPEVPQYLWRGKGYAINPTDLYLAQAAAARGIGDRFEPYLVSGEYHNGLLSLVVPLGVWGLGAFLLVVGFGVRLLYHNYRYGDADLKRENAFLLAFFLAKVAYYFGVYGSFYYELYMFTGVLGLSVSLNGGLRQPGKLKDAPEGGAADGAGRDALAGETPAQA
jgi:hypothetical protein